MAGEGAGVFVAEEWYGLIETDRLEMEREGGVREEMEKMLHSASKNGGGEKKEQEERG